MKPAIIAFDAHRTGGGSVCLGWCLCTESAVVLENRLLVANTEGPLPPKTHTEVMTLLRLIEEVGFEGRLVTDYAKSGEVASVVLTNLAVCVGWNTALPPVIKLFNTDVDELTTGRYHNPCEHSLHVAQAASSLMASVLRHNKRGRFNGYR